MDENIVRGQTIARLLGKGAHAPTTAALEGIPFELLGEKPSGIDYSIYQLAWHIITEQAEMIAYSKDTGHEGPKWPEGFWPKNSEPESEEEWARLVQKFKDDNKKFIEMIRAGELTKELPGEPGTGHTLLRQALITADHTSYHTGQIITLRKMLGCWK